MIARFTNILKMVADRREELKQEARERARYEKDTTVIHRPATPVRSCIQRPRRRVSRSAPKYRDGDHKGAVVAAENAFESVIKAICEQQQWAIPRPPTAAPLVKTLCDSGLIPALLNEGGGLQSMLLGLSVIRNKCGAAHGGGSVPVEVTESVAAYCLHLAAANILFLIEQHKALP